MTAYLHSMIRSAYKYLPYRFKSQSSNFHPVAGYCPVSLMNWWLAWRHLTDIWLGLARLPLENFKEGIEGNPQLWAWQMLAIDLSSRRSKINLKTVFLPQKRNAMQFLTFLGLPWFLSVMFHYQRNRQLTPPPSSSKKVLSEEITWQSKHWKLSYLNVCTYFPNFGSTNKYYE